jgi:hypothetical protein
MRTAVSGVVAVDQLDLVCVGDPRRNSVGKRSRKGRTSLCRSCTAATTNTPNRPALGKQHAESPTQTPAQTGAGGGVRNPGDSARRRQARPVRTRSYAEPRREAHL